MVTIDLTKRQAALVWIACNNAQSMGTSLIGRQLEALGDKLPESWLEEYAEEHEALQTTKALIANQIWKE